MLSASVDSSPCMNPSTTVKRRRGSTALLVVLVLILVASWVSTGGTRTNSPSPGNATPVRAREDQGRGERKAPRQIMFTDVYLSSLNGWQWCSRTSRATCSTSVRTNSSNRACRRANSGPGILEMSDSKQAAEVAAFDALAGRRPPRRLVRSLPRSSRRRRRDARYSSATKSSGDGTAVGSMRAHSSNALDTKRIEGHLSIKRARISLKGLISYARCHR